MGRDWVPSLESSTLGRARVHFFVAPAWEHCWPGSFPGPAPKGNPVQKAGKRRAGFRIPPRSWLLRSVQDAARWMRPVSLPPATYGPPGQVAGCGDLLALLGQPHTLRFDPHSPGTHPRSNSVEVVSNTPPSAPPLRPAPFPLHALDRRWATSHRCTTTSRPG